MCCPHNQVVCLNEYELIRKYRCINCAGVMMCICDQKHGEKFLPHQLEYGCVLETQESILVTHYFQKNICNECKGLALINAPVSSAPGRTSNILRYYWREISFQTTQLFHKKYPNLEKHINTEFQFEKERKKIEKEVVKRIKELHRLTPKYIYDKAITEPELIEKYKIHKYEIEAIHRHESSEKSNKVRFLKDDNLLTVEEYALSFFKEKGYFGFESESIPFHVLWGAILAPIIQDPNDEYVRNVQFGNRGDFDNKSGGKQISCLLPSDFGTQGYYERRKNEICIYINNLCNIKNKFGSYLSNSIELRSYLWAHEEKYIQTTRRIIEKLSDTDIKKVLHYISKNYWNNYCGWPDLFIFNNTSFKFVEVKSSNDKLSEEQKNWIQGNYKELGFEFEIFKICKPPKNTL